MIRLRLIPFVSFVNGLLTIESYWSVIEALEHSREVSQVQSRTSCALIISAPAAYESQNAC